MLTTIITFIGKLDLDLLNNSLLYKTGDGHYQLNLPSKARRIGELNLSAEKITIQFSSELTLDEMKVVHDFIIHLQKAVNGEIDDSNSFLGYLPSGESVFITKNWDIWVRHIFQSMKNCKSDKLQF